MENKSQNNDIQIHLQTAEIMYEERSSKTLPIHFPSISSIKSKKSSNIISALLRKAKIKKKHQKLSNDDTFVTKCSINSKESNSTLGIHTEDDEIEINVENYDKKFASNDNMKPIMDVQNKLSNNSLTSSTNTNPKKKSNFFKKLLNKPNSSDILKKHSCNDQYTSKSMSKLMSKSTRPINSASENGGGTKQNPGHAALSSFIHFGRITLSTTLNNGLHIVQDLIVNLKDSETHLMQILTKYIGDPGLQQDLVDALYKHSKLQWEAERRTNALANDMWLQQLEISRAQEKSLQLTMNALVKQNRELQIDNEIIFRKHEKLLNKLRHYPEICSSVNRVSDNLQKHHAKVSNKLEAFVQKIELLENDIRVLHKENDSLEQQLRSSASKMHNFQSTIQRMKTDYELEQVNLNFKLQQKDQIIKEAIEAADVVLDDLDGLKRQFRSLSFTFNWSKFKCRGSCLTDLIHMCRTCVNELAKELVNINTQLVLKEKDIESIKASNSKLSEDLDKSHCELKSLSKQIDDNNLMANEKVLISDKCKQLEDEIEKYEHKFARVQSEHDLEKNHYLEQLKEMDKYRNDVAEKDKLIDQTKSLINNVTLENFALRAQVDGLQKVLQDCGAGDIVKELEINHEQISVMSSQYHELYNQKQQLLMQIENLKEEKLALMDNQEKAYKMMTVQLKDLEHLNAEHKMLKKRLENEHETVLTLQNERVKHLEEKTVLKSYFQHTKIELQRIQKLENSLTDVTQQANKLGMIADYNKQQGDRLKSEIIERDQLIKQLKQSVEKLNDIQIQNAKEKLSLCYELTEVCHMKDQLNNVLSMEVEKNVKLDQSKEELVKMTDSQIQKFEEKQKTERNAIRLLVKDLKSQSDHNGMMKFTNAHLQNEVEKLKKDLQEMSHKYDETWKNANNKDNTISEIKKELQENNLNRLQLSEKLKNEAKQYEMNLKQLEKLIQELRKEISDKNKSIDYLQNNLQKFHLDLDSSRQNEQKSQDLFKQSLVERELVEVKYNEQIKESQRLNADKIELSNEIRRLNSVCEKILNDFETNIKSSESKEVMLKNELREATTLIYKYTKDLDLSNQEINRKHAQMTEMHEAIANFKYMEQKYLKLVEEAKAADIEFVKLTDTKNKIERDFLDLQDDYELQTGQMECLRKEINMLHTQLKILAVQKDEEYQEFQQYVEELKTKNENLQEDFTKECNNLHAQIKDLNQKLNNEKAAYNTLSCLHKEVSNKFMKSIKELVEAKNDKQEVQAKLQEAKNDVEKFLNEKKGIETQLDKSQLELENLKRNYVKIDVNYNDVLEQLKNSEKKLREIQATAETGTLNNEVEKLQEIQKKLQSDLEENFNIMQVMKEEISMLNQKNTNLEIQNSELTMRLHESERKLETEKNFSDQMKSNRKLILGTILQLKADGRIDPIDCTHLLHVVGSNTRVGDQQ